MLLIALADPSPILQTAIYMGGMLGGYLLLTPPEEWERAREAVRDVWTLRGRD